MKDLRYLKRRLNYLKIIERQRTIREQNRKIKIQFEQEHVHELTSEEEIQRIIARIKYAIEAK